jgi:hypothetical protein
MSDGHRTNSSTDSANPHERGQSLVEFALLLPMLIVLFFGIADFGRVFAAGITVEATARNAAEAAAQEYLQIRRQPTPPTTADYDRIHAMAQATVCEEADVLPEKTESGGVCSMPVAAACIHDFAAELPGYAQCGQGASAAPAECTAMHASWPADEPATGTLPYVEVRVCYRFKTLFNIDGLQLPLGSGISIGDIYLERTRVFTVADY